MLVDSPESALKADNHINFTTTDNTCISQVVITGGSCKTDKCTTVQRSVSVESP